MASTVEGHEGVQEPTCPRMTDDDNPEAQLGIRLPPTTRYPQGPRTNQLIYIRDKIIHALLRHPASFWFRKPIDPVKLRLVNYYQFIKQPMDLETIRNRITNRYYQGAKECLEDFQLMFCNCYVYNLPDSAVTKEARLLEMTLLRKLVDMEETEEVIPEGTSIYKKKWSTTKECAILNQSKEEDEGANGEEIKRALRVREPKKNLEVEVVEVPKKKDGGGKKIKSGGNKKKIGNNVKGKRGSVFYRLNKQRRKKRLEMIEKQMDFLKGLVEQMKKDEVKDKQLCRKSKRKRSRSSGGEKKEKMGSRRSTSGTPTRKTPTKSEEDGAGSSKKKMSSMGPPPPPGSAAVKTLGESEKAKSSTFKKPKPVAVAKSKPPSTTSKSVATSKSKPVATSKPKPSSTPTPSTSNSKAPSTASGASTSKSKTPKLVLDKTSRMSPEILQQLKNMLDELSDEDMADIVQVVSYYDYEEPEEEDDEDILNLKALPHTCQWEIWGMTETKLGMAKKKKKSNDTTEVVQENEVESASVTPSAVQVDKDPFIFGAVHQDSPDPVPDPSSRTEAVVPDFSSRDEDEDINDDYDEDDDTLLDIY